MYGVMKRVYLLLVAIVLGLTSCGDFDGLPGDNPADPVVGTIEVDPLSLSFAAEGGVKELTLIAQETTVYGVDLYGKKMLPELLDRLCEIEAPTLILGSLADTIIPIREQNYLYKNIKNSEFVVLPDCGHCSMFESPQVFTALITGFVNATEKIIF